ncbi:uncharacterized protein LOC129912539 [Episyrphus balteatus]|uniref:uncharacterized protein LOC129912539 n=1 Tax=Episyrphus balteatus TaxID=286459 RepID=UPI0024850935|nr:uncharacterized protein LOC129912539 [Episyrphus balteatus]
MSENYGHCKTGTVCTDQATTCMPTGGTTVAACTATECNECIGRFKCTSQTTYDLCDSDKKTMASGKCDSGKVCSIAFLNSASKSICGTSCETTPTCSNTEIIPTVAPTTSTANYKESCNGITVKGNYAMKDDLQCKKYVYCEPTGTTGDIAAILLSCSADTYFDASKQKCVGEKPSTCT